MLADARMFATLDPTVRPLLLPSRRRVLVSDTVGFIRNLPTTLVKAFRATLEEVTEAALVLHVVDVPRRPRPSTPRTCCKVLAEIGAAAIPQILVMNKMDRLAGWRRPMPKPSSGGSWSECRRPCGTRAPWRFPRSPAKASDGLLAAIDEVLPLDPMVRATFHLPAGDGATLALLHEFGRVLETQYSGEVCEIEAEIPESLEPPAEAVYRVAPVRGRIQCGVPRVSPWIKATTPWSTSVSACPVSTDVFGS